MRRVLLMVIISGLFISCGSGTWPDIPEEPSAHFILTGTSQTMTDYGCPKLDGTVKNDGNGAGYNVMITFQAYNSTNTIIDTANGFPGGLGTIPAGASATFDAIFFNLSSWSQIHHWTYDIDWLDRAGNSHEQKGRL